MACEPRGLAGFAAAVERHHLVALEPSAYSFALEFGDHAREVDDEEVRRAAIQRRGEDFRAFARAAQQWLVVAGDEAASFALATVDPDHAVGDEFALEESAREFIVARACRRQRAAEGLPLGAATEHRAAADERGPRREDIVASPAGQT